MKKVSHSSLNFSPSQWYDPSVGCGISSWTCKPPEVTRVSQVPQGPGDFLGIEEVPKKASKACGAGLPIRVSPTKEIPKVLKETLDAVQLEPDDVEEDLDGTVSVALARATIPWEEGANQAKDGTTFIIVGGLAFLPAPENVVLV